MQCTFGSRSGKYHNFDTGQVVFDITLTKHLGNLHVKLMRLFSFPKCEYSIYLLARVLNLENLLNFFIIKSNNKRRQ